MQYAFEDLKRERVISLIDPQNLGSRQVAERLGETVQGSTELMGMNVLVYGISRDQWNSLRV
jgi:RimJ/RimL family protein N-acetyltransferase